MHYMICCDDRDSRKEILRVLLEALYANGRIRSKRYCLIDFERSSGPSEFSSYDALFKSCEDGTLIILYQPAEDSDSDRTGPGEGWICAISDLVKKYRNRVARKSKSYSLKIYPTCHLWSYMKITPAETVQENT